MIEQEQPFARSEKRPFHELMGTTPEEEVLMSRERVRSNRLGGGKNTTIYFGLKDNGAGIFKSASGEAELGLLVERGTFYKRERAAYLVDRFLGFELVPPTTIRETDLGVGSIQEFIPNSRVGGEVSWENLSTEHRENLIKLWLFDFLIWNSDRHGGNFLVRGERLYAIDNGCAFEPRDQLRFYGSFFDVTIPDEVREKFKKVASWTDGQILLRELLLELLSKEEVEAFFARFEYLNEWMERGSIPGNEFDRFSKFHGSPPASEPPTQPFDEEA